MLYVVLFLNCSQFTGPRGDDGIDGVQWYSGEGIPSESLGVNGDYYLDKTNAIIYKKDNT